MWQDHPVLGAGLRCPVKMLTPETLDVMAIYRWCRQMTELGYGANGILPNRGGLLDQPASLLEAFAILDRTVNELVAERAKEGVHDPR